MLRLNNKKLHNHTEMEKFNKITGLTPQQEKAVALLASGQTITETAKQLNIERSTLYQWGTKANFQAYFNTLVKEIQDNTENCLFGLLDEALKTLRDSLSSKNESVKLKAALSIIDRIKDVKVDETDPVQMLRKQCTHTVDLFEMEFTKDAFDTARFERLMLDNNLSEDNVS